MNSLTTSFDYVGKRRIFGIISACIIAVGLLVSLIFGVEMDITFKGGTMIKYAYEGKMDVTAFEKVAAETLGVDVDVKTSKSGESNSINVYTTKKFDLEKIDELETALTEQFQDNNITLLSNNALASNMSRLFFWKCMVAVVIATVFLLIYIAFRFRKIGGWTAGLMAVIALCNDLLIAFTTFAVFRIPLDDNFVAVLLSILGYSLNDTLVIFDRVRENQRLMAGASITDIVNTSVQQSFTRTFNTSVCTFVVVAVVVVISLLMNVTSIISFALPMMVGIVAGFYSSVFLSGPFWAGMNLRLDERRRNKAAKLAAAGKSEKAKKVKARKKKTTRL